MVHYLTDNIRPEKEFRIKGIPAPTGAVRGETGIVRMQRQGLEIASISAILEDFDFILICVLQGSVSKFQDNQQ